MNLKSHVLIISTFINKTVTITIEILLLITLSPSHLSGKKIYKLKNTGKSISFKIKFVIFLSMLFMVFCYNFVISIASFIPLGY